MTTRTLTSLFELQLMPKTRGPLQHREHLREAGRSDKALEFCRKTVELKRISDWLAIADIHGKKSCPKPRQHEEPSTSRRPTRSSFQLRKYARTPGDVAAAEAAYRKTVELDPKRALPTTSSASSP
jgi:hypothetical protein